MHPHSPEYKQAFNLYLRKGIKPEVSMKEFQVKTIDNYIDNVIQKIKNGMRREIAQAAKWTTKHMTYHFYVGGGQEVTLEEMGHLEAIKEEYARRYLGNFTEQIIEAARKLPDGPITESFYRGYYFDKVAWAHGESRIDGVYEGVIYTDNKGVRRTNGEAVFLFSDVFTDPIDIRQWLVLGINLPRMVESIFRENPSIERFNEEDLLDAIQHHSELGGQAYNIIGNWTADIQLLL